MSKQSLDEKIKGIGWWILGFSFLYFLIGALLKKYCNETYVFITDTIKLVTPFVLAFFVYHIWHSQKKKEVLANEAKNLISELRGLKTIANELHIYLMQVDLLSDKEKIYYKYQALKKAAYDFRDNIILFSDLTGDDEEFTDVIHTLDDMFYKLRDMCSKEKWEDRFEINESYFVVDDFLEKMKDFKKKLFKYALYQT